MGKYEDIISLRKELKKPSVFQHNSIQFRMLVWHITIRFSLAFKRLMDIMLAILALVLGSPIFLLTAFLVKVTSPGPIIFSQVRVGKFGRHFKFYKFRSMYIDAEARKAELMKHNESKDGVIFKMKHDPRITPVGRFIRKFSIDEILKRDKTSLDVFWIKDKSLADLDNLPDPDVLADDIIEMN